MFKSHDLGTNLPLYVAYVFLCSDHWPEASAHFPILPPWTELHCFSYGLTKHAAYVLNSIRSPLSDFVSVKLNICQCFSHLLLPDAAEVSFTMLLNGTQLTFYLGIIHGQSNNILLRLSIFPFTFYIFRDNI